MTKTVFGGPKMFHPGGTLRGTLIAGKPYTLELFSVFFVTHGFFIFLQSAIKTH